MTRRVLIFLGLLVQAISYAQELRPFPTREPIPLETSFTLADSKMVSISFDKMREASVLQYDATTFRFPSSQQVRQVKIDSKKEIALLLIYRFDRKLAGWYYVGLLSIQVRDKSVNIAWHLTDLEMRRTDGRRKSVGQILSVEKFPELTLHLYVDKQPDGRTGSEGLEQTWDISSYPLKGPDGN